MFNYQEYKALQEVVVAGMLAAINHSEETSLIPDDTIAMQLATAAVDACGFTDRLVDLNSAKGFLGFMVMVGHYPEEFSADRDFWVRVHSVGKRLLDIMVSGSDPELVEIVMADPDVVMAVQFIINPNLIIK